MQKKMTISLNEVVYDELCRVVGRGNISKFIENLIKPQLKVNDLDAAYSEMAADSVREQEALEWSNAVVGDSANEKR
jgi:predicted CopG family antitoxin